MKFKGRNLQRLNTEKMAKKEWIAGAIKHPGALHRQLGVPQGQKIPAAKVEAAAKSSNPTLRRRAILAQTLGKMPKGKGGCARGIKK